MRDYLVAGNWKMNGSSAANAEPWIAEPATGILAVSPGRASVDPLRVGGVEIQTMHTPGHTPGSTSLEVDGRFLMTGDAVFVSGVGRGVRVGELLRIDRIAPPELACCVVLGYQADDTHGNAMETAAWMRDQGFFDSKNVEEKQQVQFVK